MPFSGLLLQTANKKHWLLHKVQPLYSKFSLKLKCTIRKRSFNTLSSTQLKSDNFYWKFETPTSAFSHFIGTKGKRVLKLAEHFWAQLLIVSTQCITWNKNLPCFSPLQTVCFALTSLQIQRIATEVQKFSRNRPCYMAQRLLKHVSQRRCTQVSAKSFKV